MGLTALGQTSSSDFQPATVMAVAAHPKTGQADEVARYDVSVKVGDTMYVVLYTPPNGANGVEYASGMNLLVSVGSDSLTFNRQGKATQVPIVRKEALAPGSGPDLARAPSQYFSLKLQNLTDKLALTDDQQAKIKPILEQESGELRDLWGNTALSPKEKVQQLERVVQASDKKITPILSQAQVEKLQQMRKEQKAELKRRLAEQKAGQTT